MVEITLEGNIPSKKNSRINTKSGRSFPSAKFTEWQDSAIWSLRSQTRERFFKPVAIEVTIIFGRLGVSDLDNRLTSILDMLVESLIIRDDRWEYVPKISVNAEYKKGKPGAVIKIVETEAII